MRFARRQVAAASSCARCISIKHASVRIAARVVAVLRQPAIALFALLNEAVAAGRCVEQLRRLVFKAIIHAVVERKIQLIDAAGAPVSWRDG